MEEEYFHQVSKNLPAKSRKESTRGEIECNERRRTGSKCEDELCCAKVESSQSQLSVAVEKVFISLRRARRSNDGSAAYDCTDAAHMISAVLIESPARPT